MFVTFALNSCSFILQEQLSNQKVEEAIQQYEKVCKGQEQTSTSSTKITGKIFSCNTIGLAFFFENSKVTYTVTLPKEKVLILMSNLSM